MILSCKVQFHFCIRKRVVSTFRSKIEVLRDVQNSKIRKQDKFRIGLNIRTHASPKVGQDQVSGGVSILCLHAAPFAKL